MVVIRCGMAAKVGGRLGLGLGTWDLRVGGGEGVENEHEAWREEFRGRNGSEKGGA